jgi:hypothetical protein
MQITLEGHPELVQVQSGDTLLACGTQVRDDTVIRRPFSR